MRLFMERDITMRRRKIGQKIMKRRRLPKRRSMLRKRKLKKRKKQLQR